MSRIQRWTWRGGSGERPRQAEEHASRGLYMTSRGIHRHTTANGASTPRASVPSLCFFSRPRGYRLPIFCFFRGIPAPRDNRARYGHSTYRPNLLTPAL